MIKGNYCSIIAIKDPKTNKFGYQFHQEIVGSNKETANDREKIAYYICQTPTIPNDKIPGTQDVLIQWILHKDWTIRIAKCFLAGKENPENPLYKDLSENLIDTITHDEIWLRTELLTNKWTTISIKWDMIAKNMKEIWDNFKFHNSLIFMKQIIEDEYTYPFVKWSSSKYQERSPRRNKELWKLMRKQHTATLNEKEENKLEFLLKEHRNINNWSDRFLNLCGLLADNGDDFLKTRVKIHSELRDGIARIKLKCECDPALKHYRTIAHSWQNGNAIMLNNP